VRFAVVFIFEREARLFDEHAENLHTTRLERASANRVSALAILLASVITDPIVTVQNSNTPPETRNSFNS